MYTALLMLSLMPLPANEPPSPPQRVPFDTKISVERQWPNAAKLGQGVKRIVGASPGQLQRPNPVCRFQEGDVKASMARLVQILKQQGVVLTKTDVLGGEVHGTLAVDKNTEVRILFWLERELLSCTSGFKGYMTTVVFARVMGYSELVAVEMTQAARQRLVLLSSALIEASLEAPK